MLYDEKAVRENLRNREGKRVFILGKSDTLTPSARDYLSRERIAILPPEEARPQRWHLLGGGYSEEKPEHMTHLDGDTLVPKTHPRIRFRGAVDTLESQLLLCGPEVGEILDLTRHLIRCDVLGEPVGEWTLCGLTEQEQRRRSHFPQEFYGIAHFMPDFSDPEPLLRLNAARCAARSAELAAVEAFSDRDGNPTRPDILKAMNRISSMLYVLMLQQRSKNQSKAHRP
jgi:ethanolamine utilization cobalamin adenosyltransferase